MNRVAEAWALLRRIAAEGGGWEADEVRWFLERAEAEALRLANLPHAGHGRPLRGECAGSVVAGVIRSVQ